MAHILGFIFRAADKHTTARFYQALGLTAFEHRHDGPLHYEIKSGVVETSAEADETVFEIYQRSVSFPKDAVMVKVASISSALQAVSILGVIAKTEVKNAGDMRFVYVRDPDGRDVMLLETIAPEPA